MAIRPRSEIKWITLWANNKHNVMASNKDLNRLKVILAEKKKSNLWLSKQLGCAPTTVSKWCTNSSQPPLESLRKITSTFMSLTWLPRSFGNRCRPLFRWLSSLLERGTLLMNLQLCQRESCYPPYTHCLSFSSNSVTKFMLAAIPCWYVPCTTSALTTGCQGAQWHWARSALAPNKSPTYVRLSKL